MKKGEDIMVLTMRLTTLATMVGLTLTTLTSSSAWALDEEAQAAKDEGMRLYNAGGLKFQVQHY